MNRNLLIYTSLAVALLLAAAATVWFGVFTPIAQDLSKLLPDRMILLSLVAGAAGGAATTALWHYSSTRRTLWSMNNQLQQLDRSHTSLRKTVQAMEESASSPPPQSTLGNYPQSPASRAEVPPVTRAPTPRAGDPSLSRTSLPIGEISARYRKAASGHLSRTAFKTFFESLGETGAIDYVEPNRIASSENAESFLTGVKAGGSILVFPSYDFLANQENPIQYDRERP